MRYQIDPYTKNDSIIIHTDVFIGTVADKAKKGEKTPYVPDDLIDGLRSIDGVQSFKMNGYSTGFKKGRLFNRQVVINAIVEVFKRHFKVMERVL